METGILKSAGTEIKYCFLNDHNGNWMQFFYTIVPDLPEHIDSQARVIKLAENELFNLFGIDQQSAALKRFFSSDLISHYDEINNYKKNAGTDFFLSITEQPPASGVKLSMLGMCLSNITAKSRSGNVFYLDTTTGIRHIFIEHIIDTAADEHSTSEIQTTNIFTALQEKLHDFNATIEDNVLRTWLYAPHVDADYAGIVKARKELFDSINLTKETHYIASTGIQGGSTNQFSRVFMDAYAVVGIEEEDIRYIQAPDHLSPTHVYGVTFERATGIHMGSTELLIISGTASIDRDGEIVHPGNVVKQTERTLENITALLNADGFSEKDLSSFIVYLRDPTDYSFVKQEIDRYAPSLPAVYVKAPVCRPGWLVEIEATAAMCTDINN
jgi:enamine deaminase RidA (YjgF/YER057c/UK114 family)